MATQKKTIEVKVYTLVKDVGPSDKCPKQQRVIIDVIKNAPNSTIDREGLIKLLSDGRLETRQTPERIFGFYRPRMIDAGFIREDKVSKEIEVEVPDVPTAENTNNAAGAAPTQLAPKSVKGKKGSQAQVAEPAAAEASA